jgi:hypothetical protein
MRSKPPTARPTPPSHSLCQQLGDLPAAREQWQPCPDLPPALPPDAKLVASADLPITVYQFYESFLSIETSCLQDHHVAAGQSAFRATR